MELLQTKHHKSFIHGVHKSYHNEISDESVE